MRMSERKRAEQLFKAALARRRQAERALAAVAGRVSLADADHLDLLERELEEAITAEAWLFARYLRQKKAA